MLCREVLIASLAYVSAVAISPTYFNLIQFDVLVSPFHLLSTDLHGFHLNKKTQTMLHKQGFLIDGKSVGH